MRVVDAETEVIGYLNSLPLGATAYHDVPSDRPASLVVVERTGGEVDGWSCRETAVLSLRCHAPGRPGAEALAREVVSAVVEMPYALDSAFRARVAGVARMRDPDTGLPFVQVTAEVVFSE